MKRVLIANRAAIAIRAAQTFRRLGWETAGIVGVADTQATHGQWMDRRVRLEGWSPDETYESVPMIIDAAERVGADLVYPGYGAVAENPELTARLDLLEVPLIGPSADAQRLAASKATAVEVAAGTGLAVLPHVAGSPDTVLARLGDVSFPVIVKPENGYGGQHVAVCHSRHAIEKILAGSSTNSRWYLERYLPQGSVVGVCLMADRAGTVIPLGERECLLASGGLKLIEASPVLRLPPEALEAMRIDAVEIVRTAGVTGVSTVEFIVDADASYYFLEINSRLPLAYQMAEHQTGTDLIAHQLRIAEGSVLDQNKVTVDRRIHCVEVRLFVHPQELTAYPAVGALSAFDFPHMDGVKYISSVDPTRAVSYDLILCQTLAIGNSRRHAAARALAAIRAARVTGLRCFIDEVTDHLTLVAEESPADADTNIEESG